MRSVSQIENLASEFPEEKLRYVTDALSMIKHELGGKIPLIGFSGSPWTLACYMIQGEGSKDFALAKKMLFNQPQAMTLLLDKLTSHVTNYLNAQIEAGADALMLFDTWGGLLSTQDYQTFSLSFMNEVLNNLNKNPQGEKVPVILFSKGGGQWLEKMAETSADGLGLDWTVDINQAFNRVGDKVALQGNLDPSILLASPEVVEQKTKALMMEVGGRPGHIFNLGHGITPQVPVENMQILVDTVHSDTSSA